MVRWPLPGPSDCRGDVGYIPQGCGHSIENVGSGPARILIGFSEGIYETIELSQWIAANSKENPKDVLATIFGQPAELCGKFPRPRRGHRCKGAGPLRSALRP
ncbi:cupin domain-containing protein [Bradyrhizobium sp. sBnM-33]|uniref:cupin domain-containing protein n=1 Tax=Bradyrhizobium sp. sBnM-33 TaxID=2831780 RepID=UPI001BCF4949|nr:cupin domain-containing protein [Bradyrhizobium sp. sBnM-33]WOH46861.1 cupin domain-containing protein [Bradyrhizobium sp. sBnM-33]